MGSTVVFDLDKVLLAGDASTTFLRGRLRRSPGRLAPLLLASPLLLLAAALPQLRPLAARVMTRLAVGGRQGSDVDPVADAYREALTRSPEGAVAEAIACLRAHQRAGDLVVVATGCEETLARGFLAAVGLGSLDVVGSTGTLWPPRARRAIGESKVTALIERGYPPPWSAAYSDSPSDLPLFAGTPRPVLVNADERAVRQVERTLGRRPETVSWR
jgi:phosphatidylglycerophosphatase C